MLSYVLKSFLLAGQRNFLHQQQHCNFLFPWLEDNILCVLFYQFHFQMVKQDVYLLPKNVDQLDNIISILW